MKDNPDTNTSIGTTTRPAQPSISTEPETRDSEGRTIYHYVNMWELEHCGVTLTFCGKIFFREDAIATGEPGHGKWTVCPMCELEYAEYKRRGDRSHQC